jgi:hypothetical protein
MHRRTFSLILAVLALTSVSACDHLGPTQPAEAPAAEQLSLVAPLLTQADLRSVSEVVNPDPLGVDVVPDRVSDVMGTLRRPIQQIFNPATRARLGSGYAAALGVHNYIGNLSSIYTTAQVTYNDQHLGSHVAQRQVYGPFFLNLGAMNHMWVDSKVYTDKTCGLTVDGSSDHRAWWQFYQGRSAPVWGMAQRPSQALPVSQSRCSSGTGERSGAEAMPGGMVCTYLITYDLETGVIVSVALLYCTSTGGELW